LLPAACRVRRRPPARPFPAAAPATSRPVRVRAAAAAPRRRRVRRATGPVRLPPRWPATRRSAPCLDRPRPARGDRDQVGVLALDESSGPGAVHVPDQDPHEAPLLIRSAASATSTGSTEDRQGWPATGHARARVSLHGAR